jgi:hypothetical protein
MIRNQQRRLAAIEAHARPPERRPDLSHLSDHQLELIERCVDRSAGQWDRAALAGLSEANAGALLAALHSIDGGGYSQLREAFGISYSERAKARAGGLAVTAAT